MLYYLAKSVVIIFKWCSPIESSKHKNVSNIMYYNAFHIFVQLSVLSFLIVQASYWALPMNFLLVIVIVEFCLASVMTYISHPCIWEPSSVALNLCWAPHQVLTFLTRQWLWWRRGHQSLSAAYSSLKFWLKWYAEQHGRPQ